MKKVFMMLLVITMCGAVKAQETKWGVRVGMNLSKVNDKVDGGLSADYKNKVGYRFGVIRDEAVAKNFYLQPGIYFTSLGAKLGEVYDEKVTVNLHYLQIPVLASYRVALADRIKLHLNVGPYVGIGLVGKYKVDGIKVNAFSEEGGLGRFDAGLSFGAAVTVDKVYFGLGYDLGLANILSDSDSGKSRNRNFHITLGVNF